MACLIKIVLIMPMNINTRNLKIGVKFKICILCSPLYFVGGSSTEYEMCSGIAQGPCLDVSNSFTLNYHKNQQL